MAALPTGTVTFFFSDIEGSTRLLESLGADYPNVLERHRRIVRDAFSRWSTVEVGTEGDSFFAVAPSAADAVAAAIAIQRGLAAEAWPGPTALRVRIGLHTGEGRTADGDYVGLDVHRTARVMAAGHGGQIVISDSTRVLVERTLDDGVELRDLGEHRLRDLSAPERLFQVLVAGLPSDFPPLRTMNAVPNNLPIQTSPLIGREAELGAIRRHLDSPSVRLLTLTGPGGIGKTRLAVHAAADQIDRFPDGVFFVDLSPARDKAAALQAIVRTVGVTVPGHDELRAALAEQLRMRSLLLVLDNFEQVMDAAGDLAAILQGCPRLKVMVTSREALRVRGEQLVPIAPLSTPDGSFAGARAGDVSGFAAVRLLVERAREMQPEFQLTDDNAAVVAEICARLDGLPLAIELAAARLRLFSPDELRDRLRSRLEVLRGGARDLPARQRTLRSTIEWSYELLDDEERAVFEMLSLFPSARVEAVEDVLARLGTVSDVDVLDRLTSLVDKSLVRSAGEGRGQRLSMLETIREYAAERFGREPERIAAGRRAHAEYFTDLVRARRADLHGPGQDAALDDLASELGNLKATWSYYVDAGNIGQLNKLLDALWALHEARGWYHEAVALANDLLGVLSRISPAADRADEEIMLRISLARGLLALRGYTEEVETLYREAVALTEAAGTVPRRFPVLRSLASFYLYRGEIDKTAAIGRQILELGEEQQDTGLQVEAHLLLGPASAFLGDASAGLDHLDRAIAMFDPTRHGRSQFRLGPNPGVAARAISALLLWIFGRPDTATRRAESAIELATQLQHPYSLAYGTFHVALLDLWSRRLATANERAGAVLSIAESHDYPIWTALGLVLQGVSTAGLGRPDEGLARVEQAIALYENLRTPPIFWSQILALQAEACAFAGRTADALDLVDRAHGLVGDGSWESARLKVQMGDLRLALGDEAGAESVLQDALDEASSVGARMTQLMAATRLARLARPAGPGAAMATLRDVLDAFTEGMDSPELLEARAALDDADAS